jgi:hypothetical protein
MPETTATPRPATRKRSPAHERFHADVARKFRAASDEWAHQQGYTHRITERGKLEPLDGGGCTHLAPDRTSPRHRDAGRPAVRGSSRRSSARSGDSGEDAEPSEPEPHPELHPEPPSTRRLCAFCGKDIPADRSSRALYCSERHADRDRQRRKRARDRERDVRPPTPQPADFWRMLEITDKDRERLRRLVACRCNGRHLEFDPGECFRCGHSLPGVARC